jgi:hypothetical protein
MNGAGAALLDAAAVLGAVELEMIPQRPEQGRGRIKLQLALVSVDA